MARARAVATDLRAAGRIVGDFDLVPDGDGVLAFDVVLPEPTG